MPIGILAHLAERVYALAARIKSLEARVTALEEPGNSEHGPN